MRIVDTPTDPADAATLASLTAALATTPMRVNHGAVASVARPSTSRPVEWVGSVQPTNWIAGDTWQEVTAAASFTGALDGMTVPFRAHSFRRLLTAYTGPLVRVRRSSDSTEQDIGYTSAGDLDTAAMLTFCGSGSEFVTTWYDQSGSARHVSQATTASQPLIVNAGALNTLGTKTAMTFDGTDDYLFSTVVGLYAAGVATLAAILSGASASNSTVVAESNSANAGAFYRMIRASSANWNVQAANDAGTSLYASTATASNLFDGAAHQAFYLDTGSAISTWKDATAIHAAIAAVRSGTISNTRFTLGASIQTTVANFLNGKMQEVIAWGSDQSASRSSLSLNQKAYWGTP